MQCLHHQRNPGPDAQPPRPVSRRRGVAVTGVAAAGRLPARAALAEAPGKAIDLTHRDDGDFPTFDGMPGIVCDHAVKFAASGCQLHRIPIDERTGTHIDAPLHFSANGTSVDQLVPEHRVCPLCIVDIAATAAEEATAMVMAEDIAAWIGANGEIPAGACAAMHSGWAARVGDPVDRNTPDGASAVPGFAKAATDLPADMGVVAIGVGSLSLDPGHSADFAVHDAWPPSGRDGIENTASLDQLPAKGATVFVGAPKRKGGTGGPARVMAVL